MEEPKPSVHIDVWLPARFGGRNGGYTIKNLEGQTRIVLTPSWVIVGEGNTEIEAAMDAAFKLTRFYLKNGFQENELKFNYAVAEIMTIDKPKEEPKD